MAGWIWESRRAKDGGFSLVELMIVVIIMGILAAIAIPIFLSQRAKAEDVKTITALKMLATEVSTRLEGNGGSVSYGGWKLVRTNAGKDGADWYFIPPEEPKDATSYTDENYIGHTPRRVCSGAAQAWQAPSVCGWGYSSVTGGVSQSQNHWYIVLTNPNGKDKMYCWSSRGTIVAGPDPSLPANWSWHC
jgi:prepilin-type N-terminal cleavage/methylation domain-containing protein